MVSVSPAPNPQPTLQEVMRSLAGSAAESVERGKTIFFPGDPAERMYCCAAGLCACLGFTNPVKRSPWRLRGRTAFLACCLC